MDDNLFRKQATDAYVDPEVRGGLLTIAPPSTVVTFGVTSVLFGALLAIAIFGRAGVDAEGRGVIHPSEAPVPLRAPRAAAVLAVHHRQGDRVPVGAPLVTLDARAEQEEAARCDDALSKRRRALEDLSGRLAAWEGASARERDASLGLVLATRAVPERADVDALERRCAEIVRAVEASVVRAPFAGVVDSVGAASGERAIEGQTLVTIVPATARLIGSLSIPEGQRSVVAEGQRVRLQIDAFPYQEMGAGEGTVTRIVEELSPRREAEGEAPHSVLVEVSIDVMPPGAHGSPKSGMTFTGDIQARRTSVATLLFASLSGHLGSGSPSPTTSDHVGSASPTTSGQVGSGSASPTTSGQVGSGSASSTTSGHGGGE